jgi:peptidoglycan L-alanyl-D-glutamate endopeptidase CwlK
MPGLSDIPRRVLRKGDDPNGLRPKAKAAAIISIPKYNFSEVSASKLATCDKRLQLICNEAIKEIDFSVLCGHRSEVSQDKAYRTGKSQLNWPDSKHNKQPSLAVDVAPYPIDWKDIARFYGLAGIFMKVALSNGIDITWGGHWSNLRDYGHFELSV